jgi:hypothetical protein
LKKYKEVGNTKIDNIYYNSDFEVVAYTCKEIFNGNKKGIFCPDVSFLTKLK